MTEARCIPLASEIYDLLDIRKRNGHVKSYSIFNPSLNILEIRDF